MIDIHSHVLWGLDDGARTLDDSLAMLAEATASGSTDIVATPHADLRYRFDPALVRERIEALNEQTGLRPTVHYGCECHLSFDNLEVALRDASVYTINGGSYLIIEFPPASAPAALRDPVAALIRKGIKPVIAHPERNGDLHRPGALASWLQLGCLAQITGNSLTGRFGATAEAAAWKMLERGEAHFVASDAHGTRGRTTALRPAYDAIAKRLGEPVAERVLVENPRAAIHNAPLPQAKPAEPPRRGFRLWR